VEDWAVQNGRSWYSCRGVAHRGPARRERRLADRARRRARSSACLPCPGRVPRL